MSKECLEHRQFTETGCEGHIDVHSSTDAVDPVTRGHARHITARILLGVPSASLAEQNINVPVTYTSAGVM